VSLEFIDKVRSRCAWYGWARPSVDFRPERAASGPSRSLPERSVLRHGGTTFIVEYKRRKILSSDLVFSNG
jgi:hypothetical protein